MLPDTGIFGHYHYPFDADRAQARQQKDFATADRIRSALADLDITLEDRKGETSWQRQA